MKKYRSHKATGHVRIGHRIIILGLTRLEYFDLKTKRFVKYGRIKSPIYLHTTPKGSNWFYQEYTNGRAK